MALKCGFTRSGSAPRVRGTDRESGRRVARARFSPACAGNGRYDRSETKGCAVQPRVCGERATWATYSGPSGGSAPRVRGTGRHGPAGLGRGRFSPACAGNGHAESSRAMAKAVQPRVCGERGLRSDRCGHANGSAPRVRGTVPAVAVAAFVNRFSPACAGNGRGKLTGQQRVAVQPRVCGERGSPAAIRAAVSGSAPRVRGTVNQLEFGTRAGRFSPACAGNGSRGSGDATAATVQPRVCGERLHFVNDRPADGGSAPRVRGTVLRPGASAELRRFSPACAGNGRTGPARHPPSTVQPRVCGERELQEHAKWGEDGSAPRVRGTDLKGTGERGMGRFSPACAGNGSNPALTTISSPVQPRVCGERLESAAWISCGPGSAPRVRGTVRYRLRQRPRGRFSPACAGNGRSSMLWSSLRPVQPRVCGERSSSLSLRSRHCGSAPRVRGTGARSRSAAWCCWFSPACAGNGRAFWL